MKRHPWEVIGKSDARQQLTLSDVKGCQKKWKNIRGAFTCLKRDHLEKLPKSCSGAVSVPTPAWPLWHVMQFINDTVKHWKTSSNFRMSSSPAPVTPESSSESSSASSAPAVIPSSPNASTISLLPVLTPSVSHLVTPTFHVLPPRLSQSVKVIEFLSRKPTAGSEEEPAKAERPVLRRANRKASELIDCDLIDMAKNVSSAEKAKERTEAEDQLWCRSICCTFQRQEPNKKDLFKLKM